MSVLQTNAQELLIDVIAKLLEGCRIVATGASSPIPAAGALLARAKSKTPMYLGILGSNRHNFIRTGGELFDLAAQGRLDAFFLSGGQIDGQANINLVGAGGEYPRTDVRWPGSFGSGQLYYLVPRVILFREEHSRRVFVPRVDFISSCGPKNDGTYRPGGPVGLLTPLCWFSFDRARLRFRLASIHPGHTIEEVRDNTGFDFECPGQVPQTPAPDGETLALLRGRVAAELAETYPQFVNRVFGKTS
ncbi:CoA-transferase [Ramlibacter sp. WS9]|uniref:CoA-transferase n=1 Tax=Ramlibacter sp. WS9 TaxID=1882741 RepID=UPI001142FE55|nr:CoA-transferase [Ramlibacter sp. WS9]ROZ78023.1 CoA synthetase [Ramlibacter sp. WS9]